MKHLKFNILFLLFIVIISWNSTQLVAQESLNFSQIDKLTYEYYSQQKWNELIDLGKQSLKNDIDFYYLRYRMGIAYYSQRNYRKAIPYFENVVNKTPKDAIAKEYLYYSYLFGQQIEDAQKILQTLDREHRKKVRFYDHRKSINSLSLGYKYAMFDDYTINNWVTDNLTQKTRNSMSYYSVNLLSYASSSSVFDFNFSLLSGNNSIYDVAYSPEIIEEKMKQYQLYFSWNKNIAKGSNLKLGITYMRETLNWYDTQQTTTTGRWSNSSPTPIYTDGFNNMVSFLSFTKSIKSIDLSLACSFSRINENTLVQPSISFNYFPFGNTSLYTKTAAFYQHNFSHQNNDNIVFKQSINTNINSKLSINVFGLYGKIYNFVDNDGMSIYNNRDALNYWYGASANYYFNNKVQLSLILRNDGLINQYTQEDIVIDNPYNAKSILVKMQFNF